MRKIPLELMSQWITGRVEPCIKIYPGVKGLNVFPGFVMILSEQLALAVQDGQLSC